MNSLTRNSDPYLYPGTNVLNNLRSLIDPELLESSKHAERTGALPS
jgi:hypothetical protein